MRLQAPRLARMGETDGLLVYGHRSERGTPSLVSQRIKGLFSDAAPTAGAAVVHLAKDNVNAMGPLVAWPDGAFAAHYGRDWVLGAGDESGARAVLPGAHVFDPASEAVYVLEPEGDSLRVLRRTKRQGEGHADPCGVLPKSLGGAMGIGADGRLFVAAMVPSSTVKIYVASGEGLVVGGVMTMPQRARLLVVPRPEGAFLVVAGYGHAITVHALDQAGQPCRAPWAVPVVTPSDHLVACCAWRDGVAIASTRGGAGVGLSLTDGARATYSEEALRSVMSTNLMAGLAASAEGRSLAFAYLSLDRAAQGGIFLARFRCEAGDPSAAFVPSPERPGTSIESVAGVEAGAPTVVAAPAPPPRPAPARPSPAVRPSPFGTRDSLVRFFRWMALMDAFGRGIFLDVDAAGTAGAGHFHSGDGQGNHFVAHWDATGIVVLGFDHEGHGSEWSTPLDQRDPGKHLPSVPATLAPLALRATDWGERLATEGAWIEAGERPAHGESALDLLTRHFGLPGPDDVGKLLVPDDPLSQLVARVVDLEAYTVTREDEAIILACKHLPDEASLAALARLGVAWPDAPARIAAVRAKREEERQAAISQLLPAAERALLLAAHSGDLEAAQQALMSGASLECRVPAQLLPFSAFEGWTPLLLSLQHGHSRLAELLIERGADVEARVGASHGQGTALRAAAAQGDLRLFRLLRERGASVEPTLDSWGLLQAVCYPRHHTPTGTPADYAEVIRLLLDAGAPLPNDAHCEQLVAIVTKGGAHELIPRLRRVYAEDVLPALPPPIDPAVVPRVTELLVRAADAFARDNAISLRLMIEAWQLDPLPALGDAAETLARWIRGAQLDYVVPARGGLDGEATLRALQQALALPPDPRTARALLGWMQRADIYTNKVALARCFDAAAALLVHTRDVRFTESLARHCERRPTGLGPARESLRVALRALSGTVPVPLDGEGVRALHRLEDGLAGHPTSSGGVSVRALFEAVWEAPDDDAPRQALADRLRALGDPRGELIALQLARHAKPATPKKREKELLAEHGRAWLGAIGPIMADGFVFERGFVEQVSAGAPGQDGPAGQYPLLGSGPGTQVEWSTVRRLSVWRYAALGGSGLLCGSRLFGLRELHDAGGSDVKDLLAGPVRRLERLDFARARACQWWAMVLGEPFEALPDKLPALTSLRLPSRDGSIDWVARLAARLPALRELSVGLGAPALDELVALGRSRGLARVKLLGPADFGFEIESGTLSIVFPSRLAPTLAELAASVVARMRESGVRCVVARTPLRAKLAGDAGAHAFVRRSERVELGSIATACAALSVPFRVEDEVDDTFAPNPPRGE